VLRAVIFSDVHFPYHHRALWANIKRYLADTKPDIVIALGDMVDLDVLSSYEPDEHTSGSAVDQIKQDIKEMHSIRGYTRIMVKLPGNHEDRWVRELKKGKRPALKGARGLSLEEQYRAQGLSESIQWFSEGRDGPGWTLKHFRFMVRHGHRQSSRYGYTNVAKTELSRFPTWRSVVGHHHQAGLSCYTELQNTYWCVANPCVTVDHAYAATPNWQRGFTEVLMSGKVVQPLVVLADAKGRFVGPNAKEYR
jgi:3',5'-cyclic AMP phosphodiesterase CpdA